MAAASRDDIQTENRIVVLGGTEDEKSKVIKLILGCKDVTGNKIGLCTIYEGEHAGRKICVVDTPGWERVSKQQTPDNTKKEIERSVILCPPGPDVVLLVLPVKDLLEEPSTSEINKAQKHIELLSERVWKHTILLFACDEGVMESAVKKHISRAGEILEKCNRRSHVLKSSAWESHTEICELFKKIDQLVEANHGKVLIPQIYYEMIQGKTPEEITETELRHRRGSFHDERPNLKEEKGNSGEKKETVKERTVKQESLEVAQTFLMFYFKPIILILLGIFGALIGAVAGAEYGVLGACCGIIIGVTVGVLLPISLFRVVDKKTFPSNSPTDTQSKR